MPGFYAIVIFPWVLEFSLAGAVFAEERATALKSAHGEVLEVGFGTGLNLPHYPRSVTRLIALDPEEMLPAKVSERIAAASFPVERVQQAGEHLPFVAGQFDCVVTTLTLCTIADPCPRCPKYGGFFGSGEHIYFLNMGAAPMREWRGFRTA
jgi:hypothetical protein